MYGRLDLLAFFCHWLLDLCLVSCCFDFSVFFDCMVPSVHSDCLSTLTVCTSPLPLSFHSDCLHLSPSPLLPPSCRSGLELLALPARGLHRLGCPGYYVSFLFIFNGG
ncbi:hypothetical protein T492DRAFT_47765 [Pavlovales sp. CCMP2436]|nr:hypothetical protein T492DRAFT_47765 [Pavlovales sp. CCMP2436]